MMSKYNILLKFSFVIFLFGVIRGRNGQYMPPFWKEVCAETLTTIQSNSISVNLQCSITDSDSVEIKLEDLQPYIANVTGNVTYNVQFRCTGSGSIVMSWPMKIKKLTSLKVTGCKIYEYIKDWDNNQLKDTPDNLINLELVDSIAVINAKALLLSIKSPLNATREWDCGHDETLHSTVQRNFTMDVSLTDLDIVELDAFFSDYENFFELLEQVEDMNSNCKFRALTNVEETYSGTSFKSQIGVMRLDIDYKVLQTMNYSHNGWTVIPVQFLNWYNNFRALKYLDLSYNSISEVNMADNSGLRKGARTVIDVQHNNITFVSITNIRKWAVLTNMVINIKENPIDCSCSQYDFITQIQDPKFFVGDLTPYAYILNMACATPKSAKGFSLKDLTKVEMGCDIPPDDLTIHLVVLAVVAAILILLIIVIFRYRREIKIVLYIRFHILLPWDVDDMKENKKYDAFVSYSSDDEDWVYDFLQQKLEHPSETDTPTFKLCLHQRDFIGGRSILDNIIDSVENSRHTIIILSQNFLKSIWGLQEFRYAYQESIKQRRPHLIIIKYQDVREDDLDPALKSYLSSFTYIDVNSSMFWDRLRFALAIKSTKSKSKLTRGLKHQSSTDSGFDEIALAITSRPPVDADNP